MEPNPSSDCELIKSLRNNSEDALTLIFKKYWRSLFISAFNLLKDKAACEDIIQEIFIKIWNRRHEIQIAVSLKAYLFASMRHEVYRQIKTGNVREDIFDHIDLVFLDPSPHDHLEHKELVSKIDAIVCSLPDRCREVYKLSREGQLSHKEISEKLGISPKTVETHITKALNHLRISLKEMIA